MWSNYGRKMNSKQRACTQEANPHRMLAIQARALCNAKHLPTPQTHGKQFEILLAYKQAQVNLDSQDAT